MKKNYIRGLVIFFLIFNIIGIIGVVIFIINSFNLNESNTVAYLATVDTVFSNEIENKKTITITTEEFGNSWMILSQISKHLGDNVEEIQPGQIIAVRISKNKEEHINGGFPVEIVSLKVDSQDVFTLDEYNAHMKKSWLPAICIGIVLVIVILIALVCLLSSTRFSKKSQQ